MVGCTIMGKTEGQMTKGQLLISSTRNESLKGWLFRGLHPSRVTESWAEGKCCILCQATSEPQTPEVSFQMKVKFAFCLEMKAPESGGRESVLLVTFPVIDDDCRMLRFSQHSHLSGCLRPLNVSSCWPVDSGFIFQQDYAPVYTDKGTKSCFSDLSVTALDWPAKSPGLNPKENLCGIVKGKMRHIRPIKSDDLKAAIKATWASITPQQSNRLIEGIEMNILLRNWTFMSESIVFFLSLVIFKFVLKDTVSDFHYL